MIYQRSSIITVFFIIAIIGLVLGSIAFHRTRKMTIKHTDITGTWEGIVKTHARYGKDSTTQIELEIICDEEGYVLGTKDFSHTHQNIPGVPHTPKILYYIQGDEHLHEQQITGIANFDTRKVYMIENDFGGDVTLEFTSNKSLIYRNNYHSATNFFVSLGELTKHK